MGETLDHFLCYSLEGSYVHKSCQATLWGFILPPAIGFSLQPPALLFFPSPGPTRMPPSSCTTWPPEACLVLNKASDTQVYTKRYFTATIAALGTRPYPFLLPPAPPLTPADGCQQVAAGVAHGHQRDLRFAGLHGGGWWRCRVRRRGGDGGGSRRRGWGCHRRSHGASLWRGSRVGARRCRGR